MTKPTKLRVSEVKLLSRVQLFATSAYQAPPSMEFSRQEYWSGLPFPSPEDLPNPGIEPGSPALQADALLSEPPQKTSQVALVRKNSPAKVGDTRHGFDPWSGRSPGGGNGNPLQYSCLENSMDRGTWQATVHRVAKELYMTE